MTKGINMKALAITFVILNVVTEAVLSCPAECECYVDQFRNLQDALGLRIMNCTGVEFLSEHSKVFHEVEVLNVITDDGKLIRLKDEMFKQFAKLKQLNMNDCKINHVPKNVFKGLKKIQEINLSYNEIRDFDSSVLENINTLHKLSLRGNPIHVSFKPFLSSKSLTDLDLGDCGILSLQNEFFHGVKRVSHLYLDGNYLQTVKDHVLPRGLVYLNLAGNRIVNVPIETISSLSQLRRIDLSGNPIKCTCSVLNLQDRLSGSGVIMDREVICASPPEVRNINWSKVNENELCNKEVFSERRHMKRTQAQKYSMPYFKKDRYFEKEKYNHYDNFQADQPDRNDQRSTDYTDEGHRDNEYNEYSQETKVVQNEDEINEEKPAENQEELGTEDEVNKETDSNIGTKEGNAEVPKQESSHSEKIVENTDPQLTDIPDESAAVNKHEGEEKHNEENNNMETENSPEHDNTNVNLPGQVEENSKVVEDQEKSTVNQNSTVLGPEDKENEEQIIGEGEEEDTTAGPPIDVISDETENKEGGSNLDEELTKTDEILPVGSGRSFHEEEEKPEKDIEEGNVEEPKENEEKETRSGDPVKIDEVPLTVVNDTQDKEEKEIYPESPDDEDKEDEKEIPESKGSTENTFQKLPLGTTTNYDQEGSGDVIGKEEVDKIPPIANEIPDHITETPPQVDKPELHSEPESEQTVDRKPVMEYEAMGSYIVAACIIVLVVVLILVSIFKRVCKSSKNKRTPASDVEANSGTELQDMASLLPPTVNGDADKHNSKYPKEAPSVETVNLIKADKIEEVNEPTDLNQNDSKSERVVKNGKTAENSVPPVEVAKAKFTVLLESIPRTPVFIQKRPTTINNG